MDARLEFGRAARRVDVLDAQQQAPAGLRRHLRIQQRRIGMAEMQLAVGAWREAEDRAAGGVSGCACHRAIATLPACDGQGGKCSAYRRSTTSQRRSMRLCRLDPRLEKVRALAGDVPLRLSEPGFASLVSIIVSQQVSRASADAIFGRLVPLADPLTPQALLAGGETSFARPACRGPSSGPCLRCRRRWPTGSICTAFATSARKKRWAS